MSSAMRSAEAAVASSLPVGENFASHVEVAVGVDADPGGSVISRDHPLERSACRELLQATGAVVDHPDSAIRVDRDVLSIGHERDHSL